MLWIVGARERPPSQVSLGKTVHGVAKRFLIGRELEIHGRE
jgi:hypothetical protein